MYDPKFTQKEMYDQYGSSRETTKTKPNPGKQFADTMKAGGGGRNTSGIGAKRPDYSSNTFGGGQDNNPNRDEYENKSTIDKVKEKAVDLFKSFGAKEPEALIVDGKRVYQGPLFSGYDPTVRIGQFGGDAGKKKYRFGMPILGEVSPSYPSPTLPPADNNPTLNMFGVRRGFTRGTDMPELPTSPDTPANMDPLTRGLSQAMLPTEVNYTIQDGDTLSEIARDADTTVEELKELNNIENIDEINAGDNLKVPVGSGKLTDTQAALRRGLDRDKDNKGVETAGLFNYFFGKKEVPQEVTFITKEGTTRGNRERIAYEEAYNAGLRGEELRAYMAQVSHESSNYGLMRELGYTSVASAVSVNGKKWENRLKRDNVLDPSNRDAETTGPIQDNTAKNIFNSVYSNRNGNGDFKSGDGFKFRGRGYIQLTGRSNYREIGKDIGVDLENKPELMEDPVIAAKASVAWWKRNVRNKVPKNDYSNTYAVSGLVNRGNANKKANRLNEREKAYNSYKFMEIDSSLRPKARPKGLGAK